MIPGLSGPLGSGTIMRGRREEGKGHPSPSHLESCAHSSWDSMLTQRKEQGPRDRLAALVHSPKGRWPCGRAGSQPARARGSQLSCYRLRELKSTSPHSGAVGVITFLLMG